MKSLISIPLTLILSISTTLLIWGMDTAQDSFIITKKGNIPVILTAPHGGTIEIPDCPIRQNGVIIADLNTLYLAETICEIMEQLFGLCPYLVGLRCSRKYIDVNRPETTAYETDHMKCIYAAYHTQIQTYIREIETLKGQLLIDIHGQATDKDTIFRGTQDGKTTQRLLAQHGQEALSGCNSVLGKLVAQGYTVRPPLHQIDQDEHPAYNGGYTLSAYKKHINALQLEFGLNLRKLEHIKHTAHAMAIAIAAFYDTWQKSG